MSEVIPMRCVQCGEHFGTTNRKTKLCGVCKMDNQAELIQAAKDEYGAAVRDNSPSELVAIGQALEAPKKLICDMSLKCTGEVTHIDNSGWVYCAPHGVMRRNSKPCRKLRAGEIKRIQAGKTIKY